MHLNISATPETEFQNSCLSSTVPLPQLNLRILFIFHHQQPLSRVSNKFNLTLSIAQLRGFSIGGSRDCQTQFTFLLEFISKSLSFFNAPSCRLTLACHILFDN